jgi:hypothetical protein
MYQELFCAGTATSPAAISRMTDMPLNATQLARLLTPSENHVLRHTAVGFLALTALLSWLVVPARADEPTLTLPDSYTQTCPSGVLGPKPACYYAVTPATQLLITGSGFSSADTSVTLSGLPSDQNSSATCAVSNGGFSCVYVVPDVPNDSLQDYPLYLTVTGQEGGDSAKLPLRINPGVGIYPTSGPPGTTVTVYGAGFLGDGKNFYDSTVAITFGQDDPSGATGTGPAVIYNNIPVQYACIAAKDGTMNDYGPCTFKVPGAVPGTYKVGVLMAILYSIPDVLAGCSEWCVIPFTITSPTVTVSPPEVTPGSTIQVSGSGFAGTDTSVSIAVDGIPATPSSGCSINQSAAGGSFTCTIAVPSIITAGGPHAVLATGTQYGDSGVGNFAIAGPYPLSLSATQVPAGSALTVSGVAFNPADTSATLLLNNADVTPASGCPITYGAFSCQIVVSARQGSYNLQATGNTGDSDSATFSVVGAVALNPSAAGVEARVVISGNGFSGGATTVSATFDGQPIQLTLQYPSIQIGGQTIPGQTVTGTTCPLNNGTLTDPGYTCYLVVPATATAGANAIVVTDDTGTGGSASLTLMPSVLLSQAQGSIGQQVSVTVYGAPQGQIVTLSLNGNSLDNGSPCNSNCTFTVPNLLPGSYTVNAVAAGQTFATAPFLVGPALSLSTASASSGASFTINATGFSPADTGVVLSLNNTSVPLSGCNPMVNSPTVNYTCTATVPSLPPGPYLLKSVGNTTGVLASTPFDVYGIVLSPSTGPLSTQIQVAGFGFSPSDSSATFTLGGIAATIVYDVTHNQNGCLVSGGSFVCRLGFNVVPGGTQALTATGSSGDSASTPFTVTGSISVINNQVSTNPPSGQVGASVSLVGSSFLASDTSVTISFNQAIVGTCAAAGGSFNCSPAFNVPSLPMGTYYIAVNGNSGNPMDSAILPFVVAPSLTVSPSQGMVGSTVTVTGGNFSNSDTSAQLMFGWGPLVDNNNTAVGPAGGCPVVNGSLASCTFVVPSTLPSGQVVAASGYNVLATGNSGDQGLAQFTVFVPPLTISPSSSAIGSPVQVYGSGFSSADTVATLSFSQQGAGQVAVGPLAGCPVVNGTLTPCTFTVPAQLSGGPVLDSSVTGGAFNVTATGNAGDQISVQFNALASFNVTPGTIGAAQILTASGTGYACNGVPCSGIFFQAFGAAPPNPAISISASCNLTAGAFTCPILVNAGAPPGLYTLKGITSALNPQASFTISLISVFPSQAMVGDTVNVTGGPFNGSDTSAQVAFSSGPNNSVAVGRAGGCPIVNGYLTACSFVVPPNLPSGAVSDGSGYTVVVTGNAGDQGAFPFTVGVQPLTVFPSSSQIGSVVAVSGGGLSNSDTAATLTFSQPSNGQVAVGPAGGCAVANGELVSCSFTVPSQLSSGPVFDSSVTGRLFTLTATGNTGDHVAVPFGALASFNVIPGTIAAGQSLTVSGAGFACSGGVSCTNIRLILGNFTLDNPIAATSTCAITGGAFTCSMTAASGATPGNYTLNGTTDLLTPTASVTITQPTTAATTTTISNASSLAAPSVVGQAYTVAWSVTSGSSGTPTGTVQVTGDGNGCSAPVATGQCAITPTNPGTKSLIASYSGDSNFTSSTSSPVSHTVNPSPVSITVDTSPAGLSFSVDGTTYTSSQVFSWTTGSSHTIQTTSAQAGPAGLQYVFASWSDGGAISHGLTAPATSTSYTASFTAAPAAGTYMLQNVKSGLVLGVSGASRSLGANIVQWSSNGSPDQKWTLNPLGNGSYNIIDVNSGMVIGVAGASQSSGASLIQWQLNGSTDQQWRFTQNGAYWLITDVNSGLQLDIQGGSTSVGAQAFQWPADGGQSQLWALIPTN